MSIHRPTPPSPERRHFLGGALLVSLALWLSACGTPPRKTSQLRPHPSQDKTLSALKADGAGREILMYTLGLLDLDYKFGGATRKPGWIAAAWSATSTRMLSG